MDQAPTPPTARVRQSTPTALVWRPRMVLAAITAGVAGCAGPQSALDAAGYSADRIAYLFWFMLAAAVVIWVAVMALAWRAARATGSCSAAEGHRLVLFAGFVGPAAGLAGLLVYALPLMHDLHAGPAALNIDIEGRQYWWRMTYTLPDRSSKGRQRNGEYVPGAGRTVETANTLVLPLDRRAKLSLSSPDVIHSFWVPALAGKMDMIPGRTNMLTLEPKRAGRLRGQCAEFCGTAHAYMSLDVEVLPVEAFDDWLRHQAAPARKPKSDEEIAGQKLFFGAGCHACHAIRGTDAEGQVGPDLTHYASRATLAAGMLANTTDATARWIRNPAALKPGVKMPAFDHLSDTQIGTIATYLSSLE